MLVCRQADSQTDRQTDRQAAVGKEVDALLFVFNDLQIIVVGEMVIVHCQVKNMIDVYANVHEQDSSSSPPFRYV